MVTASRTTSESVTCWVCPCTIMEFPSGPIPTSRFISWDRPSPSGQGVKDILPLSVVFGGFLRKLGLKGVFIPESWVVHINKQGLPGFFLPTRRFSSSHMNIFPKRFRNKQRIIRERVINENIAVILHQNFKTLLPRIIRRTN